MKKVWSISTTLRNPERIRNFLSTLEELEGEVWNNATQKKFQVLLIKNRFYGAGEPQFYANLSREHKALIESAADISYEAAEEVLDSKQYEGGGEMRGRQSFNPLRKMGLANVNGEDKITITQLGDYLLGDDYDFGEMFFRSFIKWQYPNPTSPQDFKAADGYNIKPFIATLHLIDTVNTLCNKRGIKEKGISKIEFRIFVPTLIDYRSIQAQAEKVLEFRAMYESIKEEKEKNLYIEQYLAENFSDFKNANYANLMDYADNTFRYFRMTRYFSLRGGGFYIDLERRRSVEIGNLLAHDKGDALELDLDAYVEYLSDIHKPELPWENVSELRKIADELVADLEKYIGYLDGRGIVHEQFTFSNTAAFDQEKLKKYIGDLRAYRRKLQETEDHHNSQSIEKVEEYVEQLKNIFSSQKKRSVELEHLATLALNALNDALLIKPNYPVDDENNPTFTAPANKPDIECFYDKFNSICEVTMLTGRSQWYNEGQPVMRHVRDFEDLNNGKNTYCLFIAPQLHRDTVNTFWTSVKYEYEGRQQRIVPLTVGQFIVLLETLISLKETKRRFAHEQLLSFYDAVVSLESGINTSDDWIGSINTKLHSWRESVLTV